MIFYEDFEGLPLTTSVEELAGTPNAWTPTPPPGWVTNHSGMPGYGDPANDGRTEWAGWTFARKDFWVAADNQTRDQFTGASGTIAVADPDEWDDSTHPQTDDDGNTIYFNSFLSTRPINIAGVPVNSLFIKYNSSWRPEGFDDWAGQTNNQTATVTVSYDGGAPVEILRWDSLSGGPNFHPDSQNEVVTIPLSNPAAATNVVITFGMTMAANDWWWAFDNLEVGTGVVAPGISTQPQPQTLPAGTNAVFTVLATGTEPLAYQWYFGTNAISGATSSSLTINNVQAANGGSYLVVITNSAGSVTSTPSLLTITASEPVIVTGQWDFNHGDLRATVGQPLTNFNATVQADTQFGTSASFGIADIAGSPVNVLYYAPSTALWQGYIMPHGASANAGGTNVNRYTLIYDLYYPESSHSTWRSLLQTAPNGTGDGDLFINNGNGIGISSAYTGSVQPGVWNRIVAVFDLPTRTLKKYLNGTLVGTQTLGSGTDARWSLLPTALLFADEDGETNPGYVNSIQFRNGLLTDAEVAALGGVTTDGIPAPAVRPSITSITLSGDSVVINWTGAAGRKLQQSSQLVNANWTDVAGTTGANTATVPTSGNANFFRLAE